MNLPFYKQSNWRMPLCLPMEQFLPQEHSRQLVKERLKQGFR